MLASVVIKLGKSQTLTSRWEVLLRKRKSNEIGTTAKERATHCVSPP